MCRGFGPWRFNKTTLSRINLHDHCRFGATPPLQSRMLNIPWTRAGTVRSQKTSSWKDASKLSSDPRLTKSCRSEMNMSLLSENNREKLIKTFLPDLRKNHTRMAYCYRVQPFNLNQEKLKTVQIRAKTASYNRDLREHKEISLGHGRKAANSTSPRPCWTVKPLPLNSANDSLFPDAPPHMAVFVKRQEWNFRDGRISLKRPLPKRSLDK